MRAKVEPGTFFDGDGHSRIVWMAHSLVEPVDFFDSLFGDAFDTSEESRRGRRGGNMSWMKVCGVEVF